MKRLTFLNLFSLMFVFVSITNLGRVHSIKYSAVFDPEKLLMPCDLPNYENVEKFIDISNVTIKYNDDYTTSVVGTYVKLMESQSPEISLKAIFKQKLRGKWTNLPYTYFVKDLCKDFFKIGEFWYENMTKDYVGEQRLCPAKKGLPLPVNMTINWVFDFPTLLQDGEYMGQVMATNEPFALCYKTYFALRQV